MVKIDLWPFLNNSYCNYWLNPHLFSLQLGIKRETGLFTFLNHTRLLWRGLDAGSSSIRLLALRIISWGKKKGFFFVCELKTPLRTNAPRRQAVLPLRSLHSLLKARRKLKTKHRAMIHHHTTFQAPWTRTPIWDKKSYIKSQKYKYSPSDIHCPFGVDSLWCSFKDFHMCNVDFWCLCQNLTADLTACFLLL